MSEHLTEQDIEFYRRREGDPVDRQTTAAHLGVCQSCLRRVVDPEHEMLAVNALTEAFLPPAGEEPFHLSPAALKNYVGGSSAQAEQIICESHIEVCEQCDRELRLLTTAARQRQVVSPWSFRGLTPARLAAAIALTGLLALGVLVWWQRSARPTRPESVNNNAPASPGSVRPPDSVAQASPQPRTEEIASGSPVVASLRDNNREIHLDQEGRVAGLDGFDESTQKMVRAALAGEGLAKPPVIEALSSPAIKLLDNGPGAASFQLIGPKARVITEQRPTFIWRQLAGAGSYVVSVFDKDFNRVAQSPPLSGTNWTLDATLQRGQSYSWEVTATRDGQEVKAPVAPAPRAQFKLLEADKMASLSKLKQQKPVSHLALGLIYARFALVNDAEREFRQLVKENPDSAAAKRLLHTVQTWR